jgi:CHAD domain-containing protein
MSKPARIPAFARASAAAPQIARRVIKERAATAVHYWERIAKKEKPRAEDIHQLRVWSRRTIAAIELFAPLLAAKPAAELSGILNKARKRAGKARDCDVLLKTLDQSARSSLGEALEVLKTHRQKSADKLRRSYRKEVRSGELRDWSRKVQKELPATSGQNGKAPPAVEFGPWFQQQLAIITAGFSKQLRPAKPSARRVHPLRIEGKRLRYALEIGLPSLPKQTGRQLYASLERLQEQLGQICDDHALAEQYRELAKGLKPKQRTKLIAAAQRHEEAAQAACKKFARWWRAAAGRKKLLRQLAAAIVPREVAELAKPRRRARVQRRMSQ